MFYLFLIIMYLASTILSFCSITLGSAPSDIVTVLNAGEVDSDKAKRVPYTKPEQRKRKESPNRNRRSTDPQISDSCMPGNIHNGNVTLVNGTTFKVKCDDGFFTKDGLKNKVETKNVQCDVSSGEWRIGNDVASCNYRINELTCSNDTLADNSTKPMIKTGTSAKLACNGAYILSKPRQKSGGRDLMKCKLKRESEAVSAVWDKLDPYCKRPSIELFAVTPPKWSDRCSKVCVVKTGNVHVFCAGQKNEKDIHFDLYLDDKKILGNENDTISSYYHYPEGTTSVVKRADLTARDRQVVSCSFPGNDDERKNRSIVIRLRDAIKADNQSTNSTAEPKVATQTDNTTEKRTTNYESKTPIALISTRSPTLTAMISVETIKISSLSTTTPPGKYAISAEISTATATTTITNPRNTSKNDDNNETFTSGVTTTVIEGISSARTEAGTTSRSGSIEPKLRQDMDNLFAKLQEKRKILNITFKEMGKKIGASKLKETGQVMVAVKDAVGWVASRSKRQITHSVSLAMSGYAEKLTEMFGLEPQGIMLSNLFVGLTSGAIEAATSDNGLKEKINDLKNNIGRNPNRAGQNAAYNDITYNNGKETKKIVNALTTGVNKMNSELDDSTDGDDTSSNTTVVFVVLGLLLVAIVIVGIMGLIIWKRRKDQIRGVSEAMSRSVVTEKTQESVCNDLTENTQSETEVIQAASTIQSVKAGKETEKTVAAPENQTIQHDPQPA